MSDKMVTIEKLDPVRLKHEKRPFSTYMNSVIQNIKHPLALAIWVYLGSLPDDWKVHRNHLMEHFDVGRDKLADALKYLNDHKLIEYIQEKLESGKFGTSHVMVKCGYEFELMTKLQKLSTDFTAPLKNRNTVSPYNGKTAPTNTIINTNTKNNKKAPYVQKQNTRQNPSSSYVDRNTMSDEYRQVRSGNPEVAKEYLASIKQKLKTGRPIKFNTCVQKMTEPSLNL